MRMIVGMGMVMIVVVRMRGPALAARNSASDWRTICTDDQRNRPAMMPATSRSGHFVAVPQTPSAASITATLPIASLREHSQTERTLASPSL